MLKKTDALTTYHRVDLFQGQIQELIIGAFFKKSTKI